MRERKASRAGLLFGMASAMALAALAAAAGQRLTLQSGGDTISVRRGASVVAEYRHGGVPFKPYVVRLCTPSGLNVLRDSPADHLHHHGLMFAIRVDDVNFWEEVPGCGSQRSDRVRPLGSGWEDRLSWWAPGGERPLLEEVRRVEIARSPDPDATLLHWSATLASPRASSKGVRLTGAHYHGLGMRFLEAMDGGSFENADRDPGTIFRGEERLMRGRWCAFRAAVANRPVTVAMFDHPANPRPVTWFTMARPFAYLSATLRLHEEPLELPAGGSVRLRYGVAVWDGDAEAGRVETLYRAWLKRYGKER